MQTESVVATRGARVNTVRASHGKLVEHGQSRHVQRLLGANYCRVQDTVSGTARCRRGIVNLRGDRRRGGFARRSTPPSSTRAARRVPC